MPVAKSIGCADELATVAADYRRFNQEGDLLEALPDRVEVGDRVSGPVRLALEVPDIEGTTATLKERGAQVVGDPVMTPWGDFNRRLRDPDGLQLTLFQTSENAAAAEEAGSVV